MSDRILSDKPSMGHELALLEKELESLLRHANKGRILPTCLAVQSGLSDMDLELARQESRRPLGLRQQAIMDYVSREWVRATHWIQLGVWHFGTSSSSREVIEPPAIRVIASIGPWKGLDAYLDEQVRRGRYDPEHDLAAITPFRNDRWSGHVTVIAYGAQEGASREAFESFLDLRKKLADHGRIASELHRTGPVSMTVDEYGLHHPAGLDVPLQLVIDELSREKQLLLGQQLAHRWATDLTDVAKNTARLAPLGKGALNRIMIRKENQAILNGFSRLPRFTEGFEKETGVSFSDFCGVLDSLAMLGYQRSSNVVIQERRWFVRKVASETELSREEVKSVLERLDVNAGQSPNRPLLPLAEGISVTSFDHATSYKLLMIERFFYGTYDFDLRGRAFEGRCGDALKTLGYRTVPRHPVQFGNELREAMLKRLGYAKEATDIDWLACRNNVILLVECKEVKPQSLSRVRKHLVRRIADAREQTELLAQWVAQDEGSLEEVIPPGVRRALGYDSGRAGFIVPLVVTNFEVNRLAQGRVPVLLFEQLQSLGQIPKLATQEAVRIVASVRSEVTWSLPNGIQLTAFPTPASSTGTSH